MEKMTREHTHADTQRPAGADSRVTRADIPHCHCRGGGGRIHLIFMQHLNGALASLVFIVGEKVGHKQKHLFGKIGLDQFSFIKGPVWNISERIYGIKWN